MPYSELHRMTKGKFESTTRITNASADPFFAPDNDLAELVLENGQIVMQGQTSKTRKNSSSTGLSSLASKTQEKDGGEVCTSKIGRFGTMDSVMNYFSLPGPSGHLGLGQDDDLVPWLNYALDDTLPHDYCSELMSELTGVSQNAVSAHNNVVPNGKDTSYNELVQDSHTVSFFDGAKSEQRNASKVAEGGSETSRPAGSRLGSSTLQQCQVSIPSFRSRVSDFPRCNTKNDHLSPGMNSSLTRDSIGSLPDTMVQNQDPGTKRPTSQLHNNTGLLNFSHFSRPAAVAKSNLQSINIAATPGLSNIDRLKSNDKVSEAVTSNPVEPMVINSISRSQSVCGFKSQPAPMPGKMDLRPSAGKPPKEPFPAEQSEAICGENVIRSTKLPDQALGESSSFAASAVIARPDNEKDTEPVVGSSSICSGNSAGGASNDPKRSLKRKSRDSEEFEYQSEDVEEDSVGFRKPATTRGGTSAKRSRAAEVHNLSERRRRDRINEKMRALQELIPNCNKVDKASMLDEAIEYLKALQLQVQIMSMGAGLYMPQMMLPPGMHAPHFSHMGVGMGMGMGLGYGMGMLDMNSGRPMMQMPPMHGLQYSHSPISGSTSLPMMAGSNLQMLGIPSQGLPMSMPRAPYVPLSKGPSSKSVSVPDVSGTRSRVEVPDAVPPSNSKATIQNTNSQSQTHAGPQTTKEAYELSAMRERNEQASSTGGNGGVNSENRKCSSTNGENAYAGYT